MSAHIDNFADYLRLERMRAPSTVKRYVGTVHKLEAYLRGGPTTAQLALDALDAATIRGFLRTEVGASEEPSRPLFNARLAAVRAFFNYMVRVGVMQQSPAEHIELLEVRPREPAPPTLDEYLAIRQAIEEHAGPTYRSRNLAVVDVFFHCALRVAELVSLDAAQLDFEERLFCNVRRKGGRWLSAHFNDFVSASLERYLGEREQLLQDGAETALFLSDRGGRWSIRAVEEMVKRYARLAGIERTVTPHPLRHASATELVDLGLPLPAIQEHLGHRSVTTTRRYANVRANKRRDAVEALGGQVEKRLRQLRRPARGTEAPSDSA